MRRVVVCLCAGVMGLGLGGTAVADTLWIGPTTGGDWFDASSWDNGVPTKTGGLGIADTAVIDDGSIVEILSANAPLTGAEADILSIAVAIGDDPQSPVSAAGGLVSSEGVDSVFGKIDVGRAKADNGAQVTSNGASLVFAGERFLIEGDLDVGDADAGQVMPGGMATTTGATANLTSSDSGNLEVDIFSFEVGRSDAESGGTAETAASAELSTEQDLTVLALDLDVGRAVAGLDSLAAATARITGAQVTMDAGNDLRLDLLLDLEVGRATAEAEATAEIISASADFSAVRDMVVILDDAFIGTAEAGLGTSASGTATVNNVEVIMEAGNRFDLEALDDVDIGEAESNGNGIATVGTVSLLVDGSNSLASEFTTGDDMDVGRAEAEGGTATVSDASATVKTDLLSLGNGGQDLRVGRAQVSADGGTALVTQATFAFNGTTFDVDDFRVGDTDATQADASATVTQAEATVSASAAAARTLRIGEADTSNGSEATTTMARLAMQLGTLVVDDRIEVGVSESSGGGNATVSSSVLEIEAESVDLLDRFLSVGEARADASVAVADGTFTFKGKNSASRFAVLGLGIVDPPDQDNIHIGVARAAGLEANAQGRGSATFTDAGIFVANRVRVGVLESTPDADPDTFANGNLILQGSFLTVDADVLVGVVNSAAGSASGPLALDHISGATPAGPVNGIVGTARGLLRVDQTSGITANQLILGEGSNLSILIGGTNRPDPLTQTPGDYGAINTTTAMIGGELNILFSFEPNVGDVFDLIVSGAADGILGDDFDLVNITGLDLGQFSFQHGVVVDNGVEVYRLQSVAGILFGDANNDRQVTGLDLIAVQQNFGKVGPPNDGTLLGDANDDGQVTGLDLITVQQNFGKALSALAPTVPEPATGLGLLALGLSAVRRR